LGVEARVHLDHKNTILTAALAAIKNTIATATTILKKTAGKRNSAKRNLISGVMK